MTLGLALAATGATAILATERFGAGPAFASGPTRVIVDTDIEGDVDDVGALAEVNHMVDLGQANLLAVTVDTSAPWGPQAVDAIDTYYGHDVPIGQLQGASFDPVDSPANYTEALAEEFPRARSGVAVEEAVSLLRRTLAAQPNGSVVIVGIGFLGNLSALLQSAPDAYSPLSGSALVAQKVGRLALMGGYYPSGTDGFNWGYDKVSAGNVINSWPGSIVFSGLGGSVGTGTRLASEVPVTDPVRRAYELFPGASTTRPSWDQIAMLAGVLGLQGTFTEVTGVNSYDVSTGENDFTPSSTGPHSYLVQAVSDTQLATTIEDSMVAAPASTNIPDGVYTLTAEHSSKVLDVNLCSSSGAVQQYRALGNICQRWRLTGLGGGYYEIQSVATGNVLDVWQMSTSNGGSVVQHEWLNGSNQRWALGPTGDGGFRLVNENSVKGLDVPYASLDDGVAIWQYAWLGGDNQKWALTNVGP